jgi:hypothetical protein
MIELIAAVVFGIMEECLGIPNHPYEIRRLADMRTGTTRWVHRNGIAM